MVVDFDGRSVPGALVNGEPVVPDRHFTREAKYLSVSAPGHIVMRTWGWLQPQDVGRVILCPPRARCAAGSVRRMATLRKIQCDRCFG